jgi:ADP-heptose:LPS heptosyltransferase
MLQSVIRLKSLFADAAMRIVVDQRYESLLKMFDIRAEIIGFKNPQSVIGLARALRYVRSTPADLVISMSTPRRNALVALSSKSRFTLGYLAYVDSFAPYLLSTPVESFGFDLPVVVRYGSENIYERPENICRALGLERECIGHSVGVSPVASEDLHKRLVQRKAIPPNKYVVIHPFAGWEFRTWDLGKFFVLAKKIIDQLKYDVVMACEEEDLRRVTNFWGEIPGLHVFVSPDLSEVAGLMRGAALVICNDSGPLHLAAALNIRAVGLFGPAAAALTAPLSANATYLYHKLDCSPCDQRLCIRPEQPCMSLIGVDEVFAATIQTLALTEHG